MNEKVVQEIQLMNDGDRPAMVLMIKTEFKDASGKTITIIENAEMWEEPLTVKAGDILQRKIILQRCPATVSDVNTNVRIRNFDGTTEAIELPMDARITCTNVNAPSTH